MRSFKVGPNKPLCEVADCTNVATRSDWVDSGSYKIPVCDSCYALKHKPTKAYYLSIDDEPDAGGAIVFANSVREAKKQVWAHDNLVDALEGGWIQLRAHRDQRYDGLQDLSPAQFALHQWHDGWRWFEESYPNPDEATDEQFIEWYENTFGATA